MSSRVLPLELMSSRRVSLAMIALPISSIRLYTGLRSGVGESHHARGRLAFWAANQLWPDLRQAVLFNDIAIALFVLDVFLVMVGWPATSPDESLPRPTSLQATRR